MWRTGMSCQGVSNECFNRFPHLKTSCEDSSVVRTLQYPLDPSCFVFKVDGVEVTPGFQIPKEYTPETIEIWFRDQNHHDREVLIHLVVDKKVQIDRISEPMSANRFSGLRENHANN
jgi:hypothetical protein